MRRGQGGAAENCVLNMGQSGGFVKYPVQKPAIPPQMNGSAQMGTLHFAAAKQCAEQHHYQRTLLSKQ